ncbi:MAG: hypothetical protein KC668_13245 [Myxococcales bacterium]|nr:hypothetical protein [Myxococcales bacterium]
MTRFLLGSSLACLLACAATVASPSTGHGDCMPMGLVATVLSDTTSVPRQGALLGALVDGPREHHRDAFPAQLHLQRDATRIAVRVEALSPGLVRLTPDRTPELGAWQLVGLDEAHTVTFVDSTVPAPPPTPRIQHAELRVRESRGFDNGRYESNVAVLNTPVPDGALALINYVDGVASPRAWGRATRAAREVSYYTDPVRCGRRVPGQRATPVRTEAGVFAYVDGWGQLSAPARANRGPVEAPASAPP